MALDHAAPLPDSQQIEIALKDRDSRVRENAIQLAEPRLTKSPRLASLVLSLADDADAHVRFQCALSLGELTAPNVIPALAKITLRDVEDHWTREAVLDLRQWSGGRTVASSPGGQK